MFFDYHLHSQFSADSKLCLDDICNQSLEKGLHEIAITDHLDLDYPSTTISFEIDRQEYLHTLKKLQEKYHGKIVVKTGIELGLQPHILDQCQEFIADHFDFVIGSCHTVQRTDIFTGDFFKNYDQWESYRIYLNDLLCCIKKFDKFSVVGHLDVIRRYGNYAVIPDLMDDQDCSDLIYEILKILVNKGKGLEVNTSGYYLANQKDPLPTRKILSLYRELGGEVLTTGSDSHYLDQIGFKIKETHELLKDLGFKYVTTFAKGNPIYHKI